MIKLTSADSHTMGGPLWLAPAHIIGVRSNGLRDCTEVITTGFVFAVQEAPEQIMAMPEMIKLLNPAVTLSSYSPLQAEASPFFGPR